MGSKGTRQALVVGGLMLLFGALQLIQLFAELNEWIWVAVLVLSGLGVYGVYAIAREEPWMLIVSYVLLAVAIMITLVTVDVLKDSNISTFVLSVIAIPFVYGYFRSGRENWGLLIPAYVLFAIGVMVPLIESGTLSETSIPAYIMFAVALPFFVVFLRDTQQRWGLVVGGILSLVGLALLFASDLSEYVFPAVLILVGGGILVRQFTKGEQVETPEDQVSST